MKNRQLSGSLSVRSVNAEAGTAIFRITTPTVDSDNETIDPRGVDLSRFNRNAPLVDSHDYSSVQNQLGTVTALDVQEDYIDAEVKFAIDVPENTRAALAFGMVRAGYLRACSIGFRPQEYLTPADGKEYEATLGELGLPRNARPSALHTKWQLMELSICVIGANPDALVRAAKAVGMSTRELERLKTPSKTMSREKFLERLSGVLPAKTPTAETAFKEVEMARRYGGGDDLTRALAKAFSLHERERREAADNPVKRLLADPHKRFALDTLVRFHCSANLKAGGAEYLRTVQKGTEFGFNLASSIFPTEVSQDILDTVYFYGAFKDLGLQPAFTQQMQYAQMSQVPAAAFITPTSGMGVAAYTPDTQLTGSSLSEKMNTVAVLLPISEEWVQDTNIDLASLFLTMFGQALAARIDYGCFSANGADDQTNGNQTGLFKSAAPQVSAASGEVTLGQLQRPDFLKAVAAVAPAALQRPCRWFINPAFIATLMTLTEGDGTRYLLKTPAETCDGEWHLVGFPVTWVAQAPSGTTPGSTIAAFGQPDGFIVAMREDLEIMNSRNGSGFIGNYRNVRALARSRSDLRQPAWFSLLNLAAS